jgi:uncharacterized protein (DUF1501 family)
MREPKGDSAIMPRSVPPSITHLQVQAGHTLPAAVVHVIVLADAPPGTGGTGAKLADRVAVMAFSEFGRTVAENGSAGTDHGTAGPLFLAGPKVKPGLVGATPSLLDLQEGELKVGLDFRRAYVTLLEDWLGLPAKSALNADFERLPLFRT